MTKEHIAIAIPTRNNKMSTGCLWLISQAIKRNGDSKCPYKFSVFNVGGLEPIEFCRNVIMHQFLGTDAQRLWMMDDDMEPEPNAFDLLSTDGDIVAGRFFRFAHRSEAGPVNLDLCAFIVDANGVPTPIKPPTSGITKVDGVGSGSMVIRRKVIADLKMRLPNRFRLLNGDLAELGPALPQPIFQRRYTSNGQVLLGADLDFCLRAKALGYSVVIDNDVKFGQVNHVNLNAIEDLINHRVAAATFYASKLTDKSLRRLHTAWGNTDYTAPLDYLKKAKDLALRCEGPILECGSGVSTIMLNKISQLSNTEVHTLEHEQGWYKHLIPIMDAPNHKFYRTPIKDYEGFRWYDTTPLDLPRNIKLVICDGPPSTVGRYGLLPVLRDHLAKECVILLDDANREDEQKILQRWRSEHSYTTELISTDGRGIALAYAA